MNKRVRAFTIIEITISMLISAVVIGMVYTCYSIIYKGYSVFNIKQKELVEMGQLNQVLQKDFEKAEGIFQNDEGIAIKNKNTWVSYQIKPDYILRVSTVTDTFKLTTQDVTPYFEGRPLTGRSEVEEQNRIDELSFILIYHNEKFPYYYFKEYSSQNLINRNTNAFN